MINEEVRNFLIGVAKKKRTTDYSELNRECGLGLDMSISADRNEIGKILGDILIFELQNKRPLLSALVLHKDSAEIGNGFWQLLKSNGIVLKNKEKKDDFLFGEIKNCYEYWSSENNKK